MVVDRLDSQIAIMNPTGPISRPIAGMNQEKKTTNRMTAARAKATSEQGYIDALANSTGERCSRS